MNIRQYLDSTYLKTASQEGISEQEHINLVKTFVEEAIREQFKLVMIRPERVAMAKQLIVEAKSKVLVGTVVDFPEGKSTLDKKLEEAEFAIRNGADDLDFVCNYEAFKNGDINLVKEEILQCTKLGLEHRKTVKWIIEVAALNHQQIIQYASLIKQLVVSNFKEEFYAAVFVKSSTGFYKAENNHPNGGAITPAIIMLLENASPLPVKAAGGIRTYEDAVEMIRLGVKRIGTSGAMTIVNSHKSLRDY